MIVTDYFYSKSMSSGPQPPVKQTKSKKWRWIALGVVIIVVGLLVFGMVRVMNLANNQKKQSDTTASNGGDTTAASKLYDALGNAVGQQKLRVAMFRTTYANKADADAGQHIGSQQSSVSAIDADAVAYGNVFASNVIGEDGGFSVGRCVDKVPYLILDAEAANIKTLAAAADRLKQPVPKVTDPPHTVADSCSEYGMAPQASVNLAWARLSDGVMPVTLEPAQGKDWAEKMKGTALFTVTDDGMTTHDGKQLHKYSFEPKVEPDRVGVTLDEIFKQASHVEELKQQTGASFNYAFIPLSSTTASGVKGFYLIDDKTGLPVYSELTSVVKDKTNDGKAPSRLNLALAKFNYSFGSPVSIDLNTPLELTK